MSDEETDEEGEGFIVHKLNWRSELVNKLIAVLNNRYNSSRKQKSNNKPREIRKPGTPSIRLPPKGAPQWAVTDATLSSGTSTPTSSTELDLLKTTSAVTIQNAQPILLQSPISMGNDTILTATTPTGGISTTSPRVNLFTEDGEDDSYVEDEELDELIRDATMNKYNN